jgi:hypothetical protein
MNFFTLTPDQTWRKLGYLLHGDSLQYRKVLEDNPGWSMDELPPVGTTLVTSGKGNSGLSTVPQLIGGKGSPTQEDIFPFSSIEEYNKAMQRYSPISLMSAEESNGLTIDSIQALTGLQ